MIGWIKRMLAFGKPKMPAFPKIDASAVPVGRPPIPQMPVPRAPRISDSAWNAARIMAAMPKEDLWADVKPTEYQDPYLSTLAALIGPATSTWYDDMGHLRWETPEVPVEAAWPGDSGVPSTAHWYQSDLDQAKHDVGDAPHID